MRCAARLRIRTAIGAATFDPSLRQQDGVSAPRCCQLDHPRLAEAVTPIKQMVRRTGHSRKLVRTVVCADRRAMPAAKRPETSPPCHVRLARSVGLRLHDHGARRGGHHGRSRRRSHHDRGRRSHHRGRLSVDAAGCQRSHAQQCAGGSCDHGTIHEFLQGLGFRRTYARTAGELQSAEPERRVRHYSQVIEENADSPAGPKAVRGRTADGRERLAAGCPPISHASNWRARNRVLRPAHRAAGRLRQRCVA